MPNTKYDDDKPVFLVISTVHTTDMNAAVFGTEHQARLFVATLGCLLDSGMGMNYTSFKERYKSAKILELCPSNSFGDTALAVLELNPNLVPKKVAEAFLESARVWAQEVK